MEEERPVKQAKIWHRLNQRHVVCANPWILGVSAASQLLTSLDPDRLEQVVDGHDITGPGKRADALMRTAGE